MREKTPTELIDRYLAAVGRHLPRRLRADVDAELRSTLWDALEDRRGVADSPPDEELVAEILAELGPPETMAAQYTGNRSLIGPRLYPIFLLVARIVLIVLLATHIFGLLVALARSGSQEAWATILDSLLALPGSLFGSLGLLVVIFAVLERINAPTADHFEKAWDPSQLPAVDEPNLIKPAGVVVEIVLTVAAIVGFNWYPEWVGANFPDRGVWQHYSVLTPALADYLWALNTLFCLSILHNLILLQHGEWRLWTRWAKVALTIGGMVILAVMIGGEPVARIPAGLSEELGIQINLQLDLVLVLVLVLQGVDLVKQLAQLLRVRPVVLWRAGMGGREDQEP
jgi:hypothetical protein